jgi:tetrapyrrole methylase family protein/MazG family protein
MSLRAHLHLIEPVLRTLDLEAVDGVQIHDAGNLDSRYHPPFSPDFPAVVLSLDSPDFAHLQTVLLNQYPGDHQLQIVRGTESASTTERLTLDELAQASLAAQQWVALHIPPLPRPSSFERFQETIAHLRAPEGCPWDRKQTHQSLRPYLLEETYEVLEALDSSNMDDLREELGDLLLQIVLHSQIAVGEGTFRMADIIAAIDRKIIRRHPHVWGSVDVEGDQDVKVNWDRLKQTEKQENGGPSSRLDGVSKSLPALSQAYSYQDRAARVRFDWETIEPVIAKVYEEIDELSAAEDVESSEYEAGDLLFAVVNWVRWLGIDPESALRETNARFYRRFNYIERQAAAQHRQIDQMSLDEMDALWEAAKDSGL